MQPAAPPLIAAKFSPPARGAHHVARTQLVDAVVQAPAARLALVRAPAGFGKTTVMAQARQRLEANDVATVWLTLDAADNDPSRFVRYLAAALDEALPFPGFPGGTATAEDAPVGELALALMDRVAAARVPFALFMDEFETIRSPAVSALVGQLLERVPSHSKLVIGARNVPDLRLARLRASGLLLEIGPQWLRFSLDETREFCMRGPLQGLSAADVAQLHRKTEGWVAGLWLASLALQQHQRPREFIAAFAGTEATLADYLAEEVLSQQGPSVRRLLLCTSVLREISAPLCQALVPQVDCEAALRELDAANMFLIPIENRPGHWRYHSLFSSFLLAQLQRQHPGEVAGLHRAAARWFLAQQRPVPAVDHLIAAGDVFEAVQLLRREAMPLLTQGRLRLLARWFEALPPDALHGQPLLQVVWLWAACFTQGPQVAMALMRGAGLEDSTAPEVRVHVAALHATLLALQDRWEESHAIGTRSLHLLPSGSAFANGALVNVAASAATAIGLFPEARRLLEQARHGQEQRPSAFHRTYSETIEGMIDLLEARLRQARARLRLAVQVTQGSSLDAVQGNAWAGLLYAACVYESGDLQQAGRLLHGYLPLARDAWLPDHVIVGYRLLARIAFADGEIDHAFQGLSELEYLGYERQLPRLSASARLERARLLLLQGHAAAAAEELQHAGTPQLWQAVQARRHVAHDWDDHEIGRQRWEAVAGDARRAVVTLDTLAAQAQQQVRTRRAMKLRLLQAMALWRDGRGDAAHGVLLQVLRPACAEGEVRLFLDEGRPAAVLLASAQVRLEGAQQEPIFAEYLQRLCAASGPLAPEDAAGAGVTQAPPPQLLEALTPKEVRLLQLLAEGYSNRALTEKLFVSDSTVRTHLRSINSKLGAGNRTQAVSYARRLGIVR